MDREPELTIGGEIVAVTEDSIALERRNTTGTNSTTIDRSRVLRVIDGGQSYDILYSGRSSWSDVGGLQGIAAGEAVLLITKDARRPKVSWLRSDKDAKLRQCNKMIAIPKADVSRVYYLRYTPASYSTMYAAQELFHF
jgi:hypothetical protein